MTCAATCCNRGDLEGPFLPLGIRQPARESSSLKPVCASGGEGDEGDDRDHHDQEDAYRDKRRTGAAPCVGVG